MRLRLGHHARAEAARIKALVLKYDTLRQTASPAERERLALTRTEAQRLAAFTDQVLKLAGPEEVGVHTTELRRMLARDQVLRDLFDICVYCSGCDRLREAAGGR